MSLRATCPDCPKSYKVPHADKEWRCKECDAVLEIEGEEAIDERTSADESDNEYGEACTACGAVNAVDATFCEECGEPLAEGAPRRAGLTRKEAAGDMRKAMKRIGRLKSYLGLNLALTVLATLSVVAFLAKVEDVSGKVIAVVCLIQVLLLGLSYAAYRFVDRKPFPIVLALASFQTLSVIWNYMEGSPWIPSLVWGLLLWWLVTDAAHVARLAEEHPDLYVAKRMRGEHLSHKKKGGRRSGRGRTSLGDGAESVRERAAGRGSAGTNWWVLGGVIVTVLVLGVTAYRASQKPSVFSDDDKDVVHAAPSISPLEATEAFRRAWNSHNIDGLGRITKESLRDRMRVSLNKLSDRYEWGLQFPQLEAAVFKEPSIGNVQVIFPSEAGDFPVRFVVENDGWYVRSIKTSPLKDWRP